MREKQSNRAYSFVFRSCFIRNSNIPIKVLKVCVIASDLQDFIAERFSEGRDNTKIKILSGVVLTAVCILSSQSILLRTYTGESERNFILMCQLYRFMYCSYTGHMWWCPNQTSEVKFHSHFIPVLLFCVYLPAGCRRKSSIFCCQSESSGVVDGICLIRRKKK